MLTNKNINTILSYITMITNVIKNYHLYAHNFKNKLHYF